MKRGKTLAITILIFLIILSIFYFIQPKEKAQLGKMCKVDTDCITPADYLIQSNCPFSSLCIDSVCKVVCPLYPYSENPSPLESYTVQCNSNADCDCSERGERTLECKCSNGICYSVEA